MLREFQHERKIEKEVDASRFVLRYVEGTPSGFFNKLLD